MKNNKMIYSATVTAPVNIATLKYWGKRDVGLNLPTNNSISVTLSQDDLRTITTACTSEKFTEDSLLLNGKNENIETNQRLWTLLVKLRELRNHVENKDQTLPKLSEMKLHILSENNFPTAAGLASSAAGYAALVKAVAELYQLPQTDEELSVLARQGSGSACRSLFGGYVAWQMGEKADGSDSKAVQLAPASHWPEMRAAILVVNDAKKDTGSTQGMQLTVKTSDLFTERVKNVVPQRYKQMTKAIQDRDFETFGELTMKDSNQFHAVCLDSYPPVFYLNDVSKSIIRVVEQINQFAGKIVAAYTYDAGPNAVIYFLKQNENNVISVLKDVLPHLEWNDYSHIKPIRHASVQRWSSSIATGVQRVILTKVGDGPQISKDSLIDAMGNAIKR